MHLCVLVLVFLTLGNNTNFIIYLLGIMAPAVPLFLNVWLKILQYITVLYLSIVG